MTGFLTLICLACRGLAWKVDRGGSLGACPRCGSNNVETRGGGFTVHLGRPASETTVGTQTLSSDLAQEGAET